MDEQLNRVGSMKQFVMSDNAASVPTAAAKVGVGWLAALFGMSMSDWTSLFGLAGAIAAFLFTILQIYVTVRDRIWKNADDNE